MYSGYQLLRTLRCKTRNRYRNNHRRNRERAEMDWTSFTPSETSSAKDFVDMITRPRWWRYGVQYRVKLRCLSSDLSKKIPCEMMDWWHWHRGCILHLSDGQLTFLNTQTVSRFGVLDRYLLWCYVEIKNAKREQGVQYQELGVFGDSSVSTNLLHHPSQI